MSSPRPVDRTLASDVVVVGGGAAGLTVALALPSASVTLLTRARLGADGATPRAQGGVAAALGAGDSPRLHAADTLAVARDLADPRAVEILTGEGPARIRELAALGVAFDRQPNGQLALGREAGHSRKRIVHCDGDATGAALSRGLIAALAVARDVSVVQQSQALELVVDGGRVVGVLAREGGGRTTLHLARAVVLATGGAGRLYSHTTNPPPAAGDGLAMAARAGALLVDLEFVQFHPTALDVGADPMPLVTEALRGAGARLVDESGRRFMPRLHEAAELAPRDVLARAIWRRLQRGERSFLDGRRAVGDRFPSRFPTVFALCRSHGIDPRTDLIPVAPGAHYHMGGVWVDDNGRSSIDGLWACGEVASTGTHGANRLASNSLLEALVFGSRVARDVAETLAGATLIGFDSKALRGSGAAAGEPSSGEELGLVAGIRRSMWNRVGVERDEPGLAAATDFLDHPDQTKTGSAELRNLVTVARLVTAAARARRESRGSHFRRDYPTTSPGWGRRLLLGLDPEAEKPRLAGWLPVAMPAPRTAEVAP